METTKHLLVDGANVVHAWPELRALFKRDPHTARARLIADLQALHDAGGLRVTIVFDGRGPDLVIERPTGQPTFSVIYTPASLTADDVIEQLVGKAADASTCEVATDDQAERSTIEAAGAIWLRPADLEKRVQSAGRRISAKIGNLQQENSKAWRKTRG